MAAVCVAAAGTVYFVSGNGRKETGGFVIETESAVTYVPEEATVQMLYVYVCGCVNSPGMVCLSEGSRIYDALEAAGGMTGEADVNILNQAELLYDGEKVYVPALSEEYTEPDVNNGKININTADSGQLMTLPGIGQSRAEAIISYREKNGKFQSTEEIMNVSGIKTAAFNRIKDYICI